MMATRSFYQAQARSFAKRYFMINYEYTNDTYYKRIPHRDQHEKELSNLKAKNGHTTKIIAAPHFPYDGNSIFVEVDSSNEDGGMSEVKSFVQNDPYVKNKLVKSYEIREFALKSSTTDFDRLS